MRLPLKLSEIDREHLQELFDAAGMARDQLPYTPQFDALWEGFQDRTFKNAEREQVYGALLKYTRTGSRMPAGMAESKLTPEQLKQLKSILSRQAKGGKVLPYSDEFTKAKAEFSRLHSKEWEEGEFWIESLHALGTKRKPPVRTKKAKVEVEEESGGDEE